VAETVGFILLTAATASTATAATVGGTVLFGTVTVAGALGTAAILGASIAVSYAAQPNVPRPNDGTQPLKQAIAPRPFGYGRCRISGPYILFEAPEADAPGSEFSYDVIALHQGKMGAIQHYFLNEDLVYVGGDGYLDGIADADDGRYDIAAGGTDVNVIIKTRSGLPTETAYAELVAALPAIWTNDHRGDGIASLMLASKASTNIENQPRYFPRGLPKPSVVADLSPVFDPRDPAQDREDADTWAVSTNPVLQLLDYLTHAERGPALDWDEVVEPVIDDLMAEADICDELVTRADGSTEKRYQSSGWAYLTTDPADVIAAIMATCDGWFAEKGDGTLALAVGQYRAPTVTLTDDHIIGFTIAHGVADEELVNEIQFSHTAPGNDYRQAPGNAWQDTASIAEVGRIRSRPQEFSWVQSHSQCRRLAKRHMARHTATRRGTLKVSLYGTRALGQRWLRVQSDSIDDLADAVIEIPPSARARVDIMNACVIFEWVLVNPNEIEAWDPATEEGTAPTFDSKLTPTPTGMALAASGSAIQVTIDEPPGARTDLGFAVEWRLDGSVGAWTRQTFTFAQVTDLGASWRVTTAVVAAGTYDVRIASIGAGANSALSPWTTEDAVTI
jgi:hypothetical protein